MKLYKTKQAFDYKKHLLISLCIVVSIAIGFGIAYLGQGKSFIEDKKTVISTIITLFGLGLTSAIFVAQTLDTANWDAEKIDKANHLKISLAKSLGLTALLILISIILEFALSLVPIKENNPNILPLIFNSLIYTAFSYIIILQTDVICCFLQIMKLKRKH